MSYNPSSYDALAESGDSFSSSSFSEKSVRLGFVRKVYAILLCQLAVTMGFICLFLYVPQLKLYSAENVWLWAVAMVLVFVCIITLACCPNVRRSFPTNMIFLGIFTICESFLLGSVASYYDKDQVLIAVGVTAAVALGLTIFAMQTKWDFTMWSGGLLVLLIVLLLFGLMAAIMRDRVVDIIYASLGALVFSMYLVIDTQLMMGGKHQYSLSPEEYIFAALNLYLDIVNLFVFLLSLISSARN